MAAAMDIIQSVLPPIKMDPTANLPLSPTASTKDEPLPQGFDDLVHHLGTPSFAQEQFMMGSNNFQDGGRISPPIPQAPLGSPPMQHGPMLHHRDHHHQQQQQQQQQQQHVYANEYTYNNRDHAAYTPHDGVYPSPDEPPYSTPASSPSQRSDVLNPRDGAVQAPVTAPATFASKARVQKPKRKRARERSDRDKVHLEKPLSELGEEWKKSMLEIETYINRSAEERRKEIDSDRKQPGKVKRPMNSFMLYRKAFQNHTKAYCEHNNHQVVSKVCGASWDQEPEHIRKQFADWAKLERTNHQKAHPGYKFTPAKPKSQKRRRESEEETSELELYDWETGQKARAMRSHTSTSTPEHELYTQQGYYPPPAQYPQQQQLLPSRSILSSYGYSNPSKQMPMPYGSFGLGQPSHYITSNPIANPHYQQRGYVLDNMAYSKDTPAGNTYSQSLPTGLLDSYVSPPQRHALEPTPPPPPARYIPNTQETGLYTLHAGSFDASNPLHLPENGMENANSVDFHSFSNVGAQQAMGEGLSNVFTHETLLQDQQAHQFLKGDDSSWDIQQLDEGQAGQAYDDWGVDPSLSQPYGLSDPSLAETYAAQD